MKVSWCRDLQRKTPVCNSPRKVTLSDENVCNLFAPGKLKHYFDRMSCRTTFSVKQSFKAVNQFVASCRFWLQKHNRFETKRLLGYPETRTERHLLLVFIICDCGIEALPAKSRIRSLIMTEINAQTFAINYS